MRPDQGRRKLLIEMKENKKASHLIKILGMLHGGGRRIRGNEYQTF